MTERSRQARPEPRRKVAEARAGWLPIRVWRSIFRGPILPRTDRERRWVVFNHLLLHLRPMRVAEPTIRYTHTFGLGGMSIVLVTLLMITGGLLMFAYEPSPERAYASIQSLHDDVPFGGFVRGVHYWCANLVILVVTLHLVRVFLTGAIHGARQFNWVIGLCLLGCVLLSNFTGYLLPWDQLSYWAITISTGMMSYVPVVGEWAQRVVRGGEEIGASTAILFYTLHTTISPVTIIILMAFHFWRVRKAGGVVVPPFEYRGGERAATCGGDRVPQPADPGKPPYVLFLPHLLLRETVVALILIALVLLLATFFTAPLGEPANPGMSPNPAKAPWYFLGLQELLLHVHPTFAVLVIPVLVTAALLLIPYWRHDRELAGAWFLSAKGRRMGAIAASGGLLLTPIWIALDERVGGPGAWIPAAPSWVMEGLLPLVIVLLVTAGLYRWLQRRFAATSHETMQAVFLFYLFALIVLTITGIWFRGEGMALTWPWRM